MLFLNIPKLLKMSMSPDVWRQLLKIYRGYKKDESFSKRGFIRMMLKILEGERINEHEGKFVISSFMPPLPSKAMHTHAFAVQDREHPYACQMNSKRTAPISTYISVTNQCIYNCVHCSAKGRAPAEDLSLQQMKTLIKGLQKMGTSIIGFTGGEPLLRKDILEIIRSVDERSITYLFTSGTGLTLEKAKQLKAAGLFGVGISLDSYDPKIHSQMRNNDKLFSIATQAIGNAQEAGLYTMVQTVVPKGRIHEEELYKLFDFAQELGAHEVKILEPIRCGKLSESEEDIFYTESDRRRLIEIQKKANKRSNFPKITTFAFTESKEKFGCGAGTQHSYINASGDLFPCDFVPLSFGNVKDKEIGTLWREMNEYIGNPKIGCFAFHINDEIQNRNPEALPLPIEDSIELCQKCQSKKFPDFYQSMKK